MQQIELKTTFRCKTVFKDDMIKPEEADFYFDLFKDSLNWVEGVRSRKGFTRLAAHLTPGQNKFVDYLIQTAMLKLCPDALYAISHIYVNYYKDGKMWTPNHSHKGTHQIVISLGATRQLKVAKKTYEMNSGSAILFGSSTHGVPKQPNLEEGRISIATFMKRIQ